MCRSLNPKSKIVGHKAGVMPKKLIQSVSFLEPSHDDVRSKRATSLALRLTDSARARACLQPNLFFTALSFRYFCKPSLEDMPPGPW